MRGSPRPGTAEPATGMNISCLRVRGFRNLSAQELSLTDGTTLLWGPNGAGKTNLLEAMCVVLAGHSCRTRNDREMLAFGDQLGRVEATVVAAAETRQFLWSLGRDGERRHLIDGNPLRAEHAVLRPALAIFLPDRLALIKGAPGERRGHLDRLVAALWPSRAEARRRYGRALAQRNALLARARANTASTDSLDAWERELASAGVELAQARAGAVSALAPEFGSAAAELGLPADARLRYVSRFDGDEPAELAAELRARREADLARGYTTLGPHRDELAISLGDRALRSFGSQGEQRTALLALLFAERRALLEARRAPPLMLLDDVMSELDPDRRELLARRLAEGRGQAILTATERSQLPDGCPRTELAIRGGEAVAPPPGVATGSGLKALASLAV